MPAIDRKRLRTAMDNAGVSVAELARRCDVSVSYMAKIVNGSVQLSRTPALRHKIARNLNVFPDWIEKQETAA